MIGHRLRYKYLKLPKPLIFNLLKPIGIVRYKHVDEIRKEFLNFNVPIIGGHVYKWIQINLCHMNFEIFKNTT